LGKQSKLIKILVLAICVSKKDRNEERKECEKLEIFSNHKKATNEYILNTSALI
jgi:hypothetical protein